MTSKVKTVNVGERAYALAPLKMNEIEDLVEGPMDPAESYAAKRERTWKTIHASLKRASAEAPSIEELKSTLDLDEYLELHNEVLVVSKVRVPKEESKEA